MDRIPRRLAGTLAGWRATLRIARRTAARTRGRSLLVLAMIALPVYAGTLIAVAARTAAVPWQVQADWHLGRADARLTARLLPGSSPHPRLPAGTRVVRDRQWVRVPVRARAGAATVTSFAVDLADPIETGRFRIHSGRAPRGTGEVALSARLASDLHAGLGDTVTVGRPARDRRVVAVVDQPASLSARFVLTAANAPVPGQPGEGLVDLLVDLPGDPDPSRASRVADTCACDGMLTRTSFRPIPRPVTLADIGPVVLIVGFAVAEVALLAGAAFAVGARRQARELGLVAAAGGNPRHVAQIVLGGGLVLGAAGGVLGAAAGVVTVAAGRPVVQRAVDHVVDHTVVRPGDLAGIVALAVFSGLVAASLPALGAARQPVLAALSGRRTRARTGRRAALAGAGTIGVGVVVTALGAAGHRIEFVTVGSVLGLAGIVLCAPALVGVVGGAGSAAWACRVARLVGWLPLGVRLALRDGARHRNRTGAAVAAVTAAVAGSMALNLYLASQDDQRARQPTQLRLGQVQVVGDPVGVARLTESALAPVARRLPVRDTIAVRDAVAVPGSSGSASLEPLIAAGQGGQWYGSVALGDARLVRAITHRAVPAEVSAVLEKGGAVVVQPSLRPRQGRITVRVPVAGGSSARVDLPAVVFGAVRTYSALPAVVVGPAAAARLRVHPVTTSFLLDTTRTPRRSEELAAQRAFGELTARRGVGGFAALTVERGHSSDLAASLLGLIGVSALVTLVATGIAVGLAVAESRDDLSTLAAVGAPPGVRRTLSAAQAGVIAGLGTVLGLLGGILPAAGVIGMDSELRFVVPWRYLALFAAVPALATLLAGAVTRSRLVLVRRLT